MRSALINQIARKSLRLSPKSRIEFSNGKQITAISTDASYAEWCFPLLVQAIVEPFAIVLGFILLILNLGPSALVVSISDVDNIEPADTRLLSGGWGACRQFAFHRFVDTRPCNYPSAAAENGRSSSKANNGNP